MFDLEVIKSEFLYFIELFCGRLPFFSPVTERSLSS